MSMLIGNAPTDYTLPKYNGGNTKLSDSTGKIILLSFIDIIQGWNWMSRLVEIQNDPSIIGISSNVQIIANVYNYLDAGAETVLGTPYSGSINDWWISDKIAATGITGINFPVLVNGGWASSIASNYYTDIHADPDFSGLINTYLFTYLISKDFKVMDKWHLDTTVNANPIAFNRFTSIGTFNSADLPGTKPFAVQRITNLNASPKILSADPTQLSILSSLNTVKATFSKLVNGADSLAGYSLGGSSGLSVANASFTGADRVENVATLTISGTPSSGAFDLTTTASLTDTAGTVLPAGSNSINYVIDVTGPAILSSALAADNSSITINFSEAVYAAVNKTGSLSASSFSLTFTRNGGTTTNVTISSVTHTSGSTSAIIYLSVTGSPSGSETIEIEPANASSIYDSVGNASAASITTGIKNLFDLSAPVVILSNTPAAITNETAINITVSGTDVTAYKYKIDAASYGSEIPVATAITAGALAEGAHTLSVIGRDAAGNWQTTPTICSWSIDSQSPVVTAFTLTSPNPATSTAITFTLIASDNTAVSGWMITESSARPGASDSGWLTTLPTGFVLSSTLGAKEIYAWVKDSVANVSTVNAQSHFSVTLNAIDKTPPRVLSVKINPHLGK
jgi:hypothetical protein